MERYLFSYKAKHGIRGMFQIFITALRRIGEAGSG